MMLRPWWRASACLAVGLSVAACQSFDVEDNQFAIIAVPIEVVEGGFETRPSAFFFEGRGVRLATTQVGNQGCIAQNLTQPPPDTFEDIDAGDGIDVVIGTPEPTDQGLLLPSGVGTRVLYELPVGDALAIQPGDRVTVTIPGAAGGFPPRVLSINTVTDFEPVPVTLPTTGSDLEVRWAPGAPNSGTAMFYSFRYSTGGDLLDREIACVFADDGTGLVSATLLPPFAQASVRVIYAQRALITVERVENAITHFTSSLIKIVPIVAAP